NGGDSGFHAGPPTYHYFLFSSGGGAFYQYIERNYNGVKSTPWEGGQYGFVRDPTDTAGGVVYTRFHEGIDIRPLHRDTHGEPVDEGCAIADGKVVHTILVLGYLNYGQYIVTVLKRARSDTFSLYGRPISLVVRTCS